MTSVWPCGARLLDVSLLPKIVVLTRVLRSVRVPSLTTTWCVATTVGALKRMGFVIRSLPNHSKTQFPIVPICANSIARSLRVSFGFGGQKMVWLQSHQLLNHFPKSARYLQLMTINGECWKGKLIGMLIT